jgi:hypothetical protein
MVVDAAVALRAQCHEVVLVVAPALAAPLAVMDQHGPSYPAAFAHAVTALHHPGAHLVLHQFGLSTMIPPTGSGSR